MCRNISFLSIFKYDLEGKDYNGYHHKFGSVVLKQSID